MVDERRAGVAVAGEHVQHARRAAPTSSASSPRRSADSGVCSAGLSTTVQPAASAGASFQSGHQQREVPRHDLPAHAHRLAARVAVHVRRRHRQHVALDLRRPAREVAQVPGAAADVHVLGEPHRLAVVGRLDLRELHRVLLERSRQRQHQRARARRAASSPRGPPRTPPARPRTARSTSSAPACATRASSRPVAGSSVANVRPSAAGGRSSPISRRCSPAMKARASEPRASGGAAMVVRAHGCRLLWSEDDLQRLAAVIQSVRLRGVVEAHVVGDQRRGVEHARGHQREHAVDVPDHVGVAGSTRAGT